MSHGHRASARAARKVLPGGIAFGCLLLAVLLAGCTRAHYRQQADQEVYALIREKNTDARVALTNFSVEPPISSRLHDPNDKDKPPPPPDDPDAHRYLQVVDGKKGARVWEKRGQPVPVDDGQWRKYLPYDEKGRVRLDITNAMHIGLLNSRAFQQEREDLYLAALDVTFERFRFDVQFGFGSSTLYTETRPEYYASTGAKPAGMTLKKADTASHTQADRIAATGGELLIGLANDVVWNIKGPGEDTFSSVANFSVVQPLLRGASRAKVLERLTLSERRLLDNVRQMYQYQQGFVVELVTGRYPGEGPTRSGAIGSAGLGLLAGTPTGRSATADAGGFLGMLQEEQLVLNTEANVAALRTTHEQLQSAFEAGRLSSRLQVDQALVSLYRGQSSLLSARAAYKARVEAFKMYLGLPPEIEVSVKDPLIERFTLMDPEITRLQADADAIAQHSRDRDRVRTIPQLKTLLQPLEKIRPAIMQQWDEAQQDLANFRAVIAQRKAQMKTLQNRPEVAEAGLNPKVLQAESLDDDLKLVEQNMTRLKKQLDGALSVLEHLSGQLDQMNVEEARDSVSSATSELSSLLLELSLSQASARLQQMMLEPVAVTMESALAVARENRLDWRNARAQLVDAWRRVETDADALRGDVSITMNGDLRTTDNNPAHFDEKTARLRLGLTFDTPLIRQAERNTYRQTLIEFQKARRDYLLFEDRITQSLRNTVRLVDLSLVNFEIRRAAVESAIRQVDLARLRLTEPPRPGVQAVFGATTARDLLSALSDLLDAQNDFLKSWVNYYVLRMLLDFELGTMKLNQAGLWQDPGALTLNTLAPAKEKIAIMARDHLTPEAP